MSLRQDVLRCNTADFLQLKLTRLTITRRTSSVSSQDREDSGDELVNVISLPVSQSDTRSPSPTKPSARRLHTPTSVRDPLKAFPRDIVQKIFSKLSLKDLSQCALVSKKWNRSQTLNYVWFQHYRQENFHDTSVPSGKWSTRESRQNWRVLHIQSTAQRSPTSPARSSAVGPRSRRSPCGGSGNTSPSASGKSSGHQTPREIKEQKWRLERENTKPGKVEMRMIYKDMGGRKSRSKTKLGSGGAKGTRDKGGWSDSYYWE